VKRLRSKVVQLRIAQVLILPKAGHCKLRNGQCTNNDPAGSRTARSKRGVLRIRDRGLWITLVVFLLVSIFQGVSFAQPKAEPKKQPEARKAEPVPPKFNVGEFTYTSANRRDPFETVFLTNIKQSAGKATASKKGYELEELKLVGIMKTGNKNLAMMEDMQGKGMLFRKNDYLNKNLWIVDILTDKVEFGYKIKGEIKTFTIDIPRKKEGM